MEPTITYSVVRINWNKDNPLVISDVICKILVEMGGKEFTQGFATDLEFLDPTDPTFINIREMLEEGRKEETFPYLIDFAKETYNKKATLPLTDEELANINNTLDEFVERWVNNGMSAAEIETNKNTLFVGLSTKPTTERLENVAIEQVQFMLNDNSQNLVTIFD